MTISTSTHLEETRLSYFLGISDTDIVRWPQKLTGAWRR